MPSYCTKAAIKSRLLGKVQFTTDPDDQNKMHENLLSDLMDEAEAEVEFDLSPRYMAPFQTDAGTAFSNLPIRPTQFLIKTLSELKSLERVLETDFGRGTVVDAEKYSESLRKRYERIVRQLLEKRDGQFGHFAYPPLPGLKLNFHNQAADDGYAGQVLVSGEQFSGDFPSRRINDPSQSFWAGDLINEPDFF